MNIYWITLRGQVNVGEVNASSPHQMTPVNVTAVNTTHGTVEAATTNVTICTDQSGLLGLVRHLHNLGFEIISIVCQNERKDP